MKNKGCMSAGVILIVLIAIVAIIGFWGVGKYNSLVTKDQNVQSKWSNIETVYQNEQTLSLIWKEQ